MTTGQITLTNNLLTLVDLNAEALHEFFNPCHDKDGHFCPTGGEGKGGKIGKTIGGVRGWGPDGKAIPGTDAWIESHGLARDIFEGRPYVRFQRNREDPAIQAEYGQDKYSLRLFKNVASQSPGYIMRREGVPGTPLGVEMLGEVRPDRKVVLDPSKKAKAETHLKHTIAREAALQNYTAKDLVKDRREGLKKAQANLEYFKAATPESLRADAGARLTKAQRAFDRAKTSGDAVKLRDAQTELNRAKRNNLRVDRMAETWVTPRKEGGVPGSEHEIYFGTRGVETAQKRLALALTNPGPALETAQTQAKHNIERAQKSVENASIKYTNPSAKGSKSGIGTASRLDIHPDPQNVKNLTQGNGRVYWAMEGVIKADAVHTALRREDPKASVISNPSVTLWMNPETEWVTKKYLQGREVILLPDADGVKNAQVMRQAKGLQAALINAGAGRVVLAAPPLKDGKIEHIKLRSGHPEERKGVDDHLGAGRGTLGQLSLLETSVPKINLSSYTRAGGNEGEHKINRNSLERTEKTLSAISAIAGEKGVSKIPGKLLAEASEVKRTASRDAVKRLEANGLIKVEHVFDPVALGLGRRVQVMSDARINELVRKGVISHPRLDVALTGTEYDESPIYTIIDKKYHATETSGHPLSSLPTWKPPKTFKGWESSLTPQEKRATRKGRPGERIVRTKAGAELYGVPIGSPVPVLAATGMIHLEGSPSDGETDL